MTDEELIARLRSNIFGTGTTMLAANRIKDLTAKLAKAEWLLTDAAVQLEDGKIKTRRNRAGLIWQFLEEIKGQSHE